MPKQIRPIRIEGNIAYITLTKGYEAVIDAADVPLVEGFNWTAGVARGKVYAIRNIRRAGGGQTRLRMHRSIMQAEIEVEIDHRDSNGLNNRRNNLRLATHGQNVKNAKIRSDSKSGVKGVSWETRTGKWRAQIRVDGLRIFLGYFDSPNEAGVAYATASDLYHGEFGRL